MNDQSTQSAVHQLAIASVQINFAASNITQTIVQYLFYIEQFMNLFSILFQAKDSNMREFVHSWSSHDGAGDWPGNQLCAHFLYNTILYLLTNLFISITFSVGKFFLRQVKEISEVPSQLAFIALCYIDYYNNRLTHCQL